VQEQEKLEREKHKADAKVAKEREKELARLEAERRKHLERVMKEQARRLPGSAAPAGTRWLAGHRWGPAACPAGAASVRAQRPGTARALRASGAGMLRLGVLCLCEPSLLPILFLCDAEEGGGAAAQGGGEAAGAAGQRGGERGSLFVLVAC
jgi:hypothetical protein